MKKGVILEYPLSRLLCSYNILYSSIVRRLSFSAVIGFACLSGFRPVSWLLNLCSLREIIGTLSHQIVIATAQTTLFQWASLNVPTAEPQRQS